MKKIILTLHLLVIFLLSTPLAQANAVVRDPFSAVEKVSTAPTVAPTKMLSRLLQIYYSDVQAVIKMIRQVPFLSENVEMTADVRTNRLWLRADRQKLAQIQQFIRTIDTPAPQIEIAARIVTVDAQFLRQLGINFSSQNQASIDHNGLHATLPTSSQQPGRFRIALAKLGAGNTLDLELLALEEAGHAHMLSNPRLLTTNRKSAVIEAGEEIPYQETSLSGGTSTTFKKAVLSLKVTPTLLPNKKILLSLAVNQDKPSRTLVNGVPTVQTRQIKTQVIVNNQQTIVLGGIYETSHRHAQQRIPFLSSIPLVGALFRTKVIEKQRHELLIFVTPRTI